MDTEPTLWIIAGPNGVGKTTYAFRHIRAVAGTVRFVNMDEIARGLSPLDPAAEQRAAARIALARIDEMIGARTSFSLETTLSGRTHLTAIAAARALGFRIHLLFFAVVAVETCLSRVARRVSEGGHAVAESDIRRRFERASRNVPIYAPLCDLWRIYDNNGPAPKAVAEGRGACVAMRGSTSGLPVALAEVLAGMPDCTEG
jgi:predicted ABC-type ATPase